MIELLVDLVGTRLRYPPVPVTLLNTLAIVSFHRFCCIRLFSLSFRRLIQIQLFHKNIKMNNYHHVVVINSMMKNSYEQM